MRFTAVFYIVFLSVLLTGCKVNISLTGASIPENVSTVTIEYFENQAALTNPNFPQQMTEALRDKFISQTRLQLRNTNGDIQFKGYITGYQTAPVSVTGNDQASLNRLTITVAVEFQNTKDEKQNFKQSFTRFADFSASQNLSQVEQQLMTEITSQLVQDIFNRAFLDW
jgi:hypothetical protein